MQQMYDLCFKELDSYKVFSGIVPEVLDKIADSVPNKIIPRRMLLTIAVSELMTFVSHFRRNIRHPNDSLIPTNSIAFSISKSGSGKDSSVQYTRKCFQSGYDKLAELMKYRAHESAKKKAMDEGEESPNNWEVYKQYYRVPPPLFAAPSTAEGFVQHLNDLDKLGIGAGHIYSGEIGSELAGSKVIDHNIQFLAETYDEGNKEQKIIKNREEQSAALKNFPVSALFVGSQDNILYDTDIKHKFKREFATKLARRSFFNFNPEISTYPTYKSLDHMIKAERDIEESSKVSRYFVNQAIDTITTYHIPHIGKPLEVTQKVMDMFKVYRYYNHEKATRIGNHYPLSQLVRTHLQWKAFKLSGALAFIRCSETIELEDYLAAISFIELLDSDMIAFESELIKQPHELFASFMQSMVEDNKTICSLHMLKKFGFISGSGSSKAKLAELVSFVSSYDDTGIYTVLNDGIKYEKIILTSIIGLSYLPLSGTKEYRATNCASGYTHITCSFEDIANMLQLDCAYAPFDFKDGTRAKENISSGCKVLVLDIDNSHITDEECHYILQNYNHHIARTFDPDNAFKFRVIVELDSELNIEDKLWKGFTKSVSTYLGLTSDSLPKSQIFFSYANRNILSVTNKNTISIRDHILIATGTAESTEVVNLTPSQRKVMLDDPLSTFHYAFEAKQGEGSVSLIRAAKHARDLGMSKEHIIELINEINEYWVTPMDQDRFNRTILSQINRW